MGTLRLTAVTADDVAKIPYDGYGVHSKPAGGRYEAPRWRREKVPPPPNYSTPQAVTARCRERGSAFTPGDPNLWLRAAEKDRTVARAYHAFLEACGDWRDLTPTAPHQAGVGKKWTAKRLAEARAANNIS